MNHMQQKDGTVEQSLNQRNKIMKISQKRFIKRFRSLHYSEKEIQSCINFMKQNNGFISYTSLFYYILFLYKGNVQIALQELDSVTSFAGNIQVNLINKD